MEGQQPKLETASISVRALRLRTHIQHQLFHSTTPERVGNLMTNYLNYWRQRNECKKVEDVWRVLHDTTPWHDFQDIW